MSVCLLQLEIARKLLTLKYMFKTSVAPGLYRVAKHCDSVSVCVLRNCIKHLIIILAINEDNRSRNAPDSSFAPELALALYSILTQLANQ